MSVELERQEQIKTGIASALGRLRGDVIPLPVTYASPEPEQPQASEQRSEPTASSDPLRADPGMKTGTSSSGGRSGILGAERMAEEQPDLLSDLEPPQLLPPLTEEELAARQRRRRRRRLMAGTAVAAILFAIAGYWTFSGSSPDEIPVIQADLAPEKVPPVDEGGLNVPNQDIAILENTEEGATVQGGETMLPAPEQPMPPEVLDTTEPAPVAEEEGSDIVPMPEQDAGATTASTVEELIVAAPAVPEAPAADAVPAPAQNGAVPGEPATVAPEMPVVPEMPTATDQTSPTDLSMANSTQSAEPISGEATAAAMATAATSTTEAAPAALEAAPAGTARVQLAAVKSDDAARTLWEKLQTKHASLLGSLSLSVEMVDKGADGIFYRVQAGPIADRAAAKTLCMELKKQNQDCIVPK